MFIQKWTVLIVLGILGYTLQHSFPFGDPAALVDQASETAMRATEVLLMDPLCYIYSAIAIMLTFCTLICVLKLVYLPSVDRQDQVAYYVFGQFIISALYFAGILQISKCSDATAPLLIYLSLCAKGFIYCLFKFCSIVKAQKANALKEAVRVKEADEEKNNERKEVAGGEQRKQRNQQKNQNKKKRRNH